MALEIEKSFEGILKRPENLLTASKGDLSSIHHTLENLFSFARSHELKAPSRRQAKTCPQKLLTKGFDTEQIWEQLRLQIVPAVNSLRPVVSELERAKEKDLQLAPPSPKNKNDSKKKKAAPVVVEEEEEEEEDFDDDEEGDDFDEEDDEDDEEDDEDDEEGDEDDDEEGEEGEDDEDMIGDGHDDYEEDDEDMEGAGEEGEEDDDEDDDDDDDAVQLDGLDARKAALEVKDTKERLTAIEKQRQKLKEEIEKLEEENLQGRGWALMGEIDNSSRPFNALLDLNLEFEHAARPTPEVTQEATEDIESMIRRRVSGGIFDDVVRKLKIETKNDKKVEDVSTEKSEKGLGELYADQYQKAVLGAVARDGKDNIRREIAQLGANLFYKLDALSHYHFAPKPSVKEMNVKATVPVIAMEEVGPTLTSRADFPAAPEDISKPKKRDDLAGEGDLTREERGRLHNRKKRLAKIKRVAKGVPAAAKQIEQKVEQSKKKRKEDERDAYAREDMSKSTAVFRKLQEEKTMGSLASAPEEKKVRKDAQFKL